MVKNRPASSASRRGPRSGSAGLSLAGAMVSLIVLIVLGALLGCNKQEGAAQSEIVVGEFGSMTGATATFGQSTHKGIVMALETVNGGGGVLGKTIRLVSEDDQGKPDEAQTVVTKLINRDRVVALLGEIASSNSLAAAPLAQSARIPMISPGSTNPKVTQGRDYVFRVCFIDPFQGQVMAKFAAQSLKVSKVAVLRDIKSDYSVGLADFFVEHFQKQGGTIVADESYSQGNKDFNAQLTSIKGKNPEAIFVPGYYTEVGLIARQARKLGIKAVLLGGDGWDSADLLKIGGEALDGCYYSNHYSVDDPSPAIRKFVGDFQARHPGEVPDAMAALGYDAAMILVDAIKRAGSARPDSVRDALAATQGFQGVTGAITLDKDRNAVKSAVVLELRGGKTLFKETVAP